MKIAELAAYVLERKPAEKGAAVLIGIFGIDASVAKGTSANSKNMRELH